YTGPRQGPLPEPSSGGCDEAGHRPGRRGRRRAPGAVPVRRDPSSLAPQGRGRLSTPTGQWVDSREGRAPFSLRPREDVDGLATPPVISPSTPSALVRPATGVAIPGGLDDPERRQPRAPPPTPPGPAPAPLPTGRGVRRRRAAPA